MPDDRVGDTEVSAVHPQVARISDGLGENDTGCQPGKPNKSRGRKREGSTAMCSAARKLQQATDLWMIQPAPWKR